MRNVALFSLVSRAVYGLVIAVVALIAMGGCSSQTNGDKSSSGGPFSDARVRGDCPSFVAVGVPTEIRMRVKNTGQDDWPVTFISFLKGLDHFVVNNIRLGTLVGRKADTPGIDTYRIGTGAGLKAGESGTVELDLTPKEADNVKLSFGAWGGQKGERSLPGDIELVACEDLAIQP